MLYFHRGDMYVALINKEPAVSYHVFDGFITNISQEGEIRKNLVEIVPQEEWTELGITREVLKQKFPELFV